MAARHFLPTYPWARYSKKMVQRLSALHYAGSFSREEAIEKKMRLATHKEGAAREGKVLEISLLVDEADGIIADAKFHALGPTTLLVAADVACELVIRKNYEQAKRLSADLIDQKMQDKKGASGFPVEAASDINLVLLAIEEVAISCMDIPISQEYFITPMAPMEEGGEGYPGWQTLSNEQKKAVIEEILSTDIRPYIELDAGGIQMIALIEGKELVIAYQGNCTSCHSATGSTLTAIQQILRAKISKDIIVTPDPRSLMQG